MRKRAGFTLVELLVYIGILAIVAGILTGIFITSVRTQNRERASSEVSQQLDFVLATVQRVVRDSSLIESVYEGDSEGTACSDYCTLLLRTDASSTDPIIISSDANGIYIQEGGGATTTLTTGRVIVDHLKFVKYEVAGGHAAVQIDASLTYNSESPELAVSKSLQSAIGRVSAATFDSDLLPDIDGSRDLGQISPGLRWNDAYFSGAVSIGTATQTPSAALEAYSTTRGFLPPRMTLAQRDAIASPAAGLIIYNTSSSTFNGYDGSSWGDLGADSDWVIAGSNMYSGVSGNVGIGTTDPQTKLHITNGDVRISANSGNRELVFYDDSDGDWFSIKYERSTNRLSLNALGINPIWQIESSGKFRARDVEVGDAANAGGFLGFQKGLSVLTISSGAVTVSSTYHDVDTGGGAATDDLDTINGAGAGRLLIIRPANSQRTVVVKDETGNLYLNGDFTMDNMRDTLVLLGFNTGTWIEVSRSDNGS